MAESIDIIVSAQDDASGILTGIRSQISGLESGIFTFNSAMRQYNSIMSGYNHTVVSMFKDMGSAVYDFTTDAINNFTKFSEVQAQTMGALATSYGTTADQQAKFIADSKALADQALQLGTYGINNGGALSSATDVSGLQTELVKAGVDVQQMTTTDITEQVLRFAQANNLDNTTAAEFAVKLANQFQTALGSSAFSDMLDKVSHAADTSVMDVSDVIQSMKYAAGISAGLGRSVDETLGMTSIMSNFGLTGSQSGTGIQAFLSRLLTGDTTVITEAQKEVAPEKALDDFYKFSDFAKSEGSSLTWDQVKTGKYDKSLVTGNLRSMTDVTDALNDIFTDLNDAEESWFAKKFFGLYQMKAAYSLLNGDDSQLQDVINEIQNNSIGTNERKLEILQKSQWGQFTSIDNMWEGIKTSFGSALSNLTSSILTETKNYLAANGKYDINWENIRKGLDESVQAIDESFGSAISGAVANVGNTAIDLGQIAEKLMPELGKGSFKVLGDLTKTNSDYDMSSIGGVLLNFKDNVTQANGDWNDMITEMRTSVGDLPEDMQELGNAVISVIDFFKDLTVLNIATSIAQLVSSVLQIAMMTVRAGTVIINGTTGTGTGTGSNGKSKNGKKSKGKNSKNSKNNEESGSSTKTSSLVTAGSTIAGVTGGIVGGQIGYDISSNILDDTNISDNAKLGLTTAGTIFGSLAGGALLKGAYGAAVSGVSGIAKTGLFATLENAGLVVGTEATTSGLAGLTTAGGAVASGILPVSAAGFMLWKNHQDIAKANENASAAASNTSSDAILIGGDGRALYNKDGTVKTTKDTQLQNRSGYDEYAYMNGKEEYLSESAPKRTLSNLFGLLPSYKNAMADYNSKQDQYAKQNETAKDLFNTVASNYYNSTGSKLKYNDYTASKDSMDAKYGASKETIASGVQSGLASYYGASGTKSSTDYSTKIPGLNALSSTGRQEAIQKYEMSNKIDNNVTMTPTFNISAPIVNVKVDVDKSGNSTVQQSILNAEIGKQLNSWYSQSSSRNTTVNK